MRTAFQERVDEEFLRLVAAENGGRLPPDLLVNGRPRYVGFGPEDAHYREVWVRARRNVCGSPAREGQAGSSQYCDAVPTPPPKPSKPRPCGLDYLRLKCGHAERTFEMVVGREVRAVVNDRLVDDRVLEVVCGWSFFPDTISCEVAPTRGPCAEEHRNKVFDLVPDPDGVVPRQSGNKLQFTARSKNLLQILRERPFSLIWPEDAPTAEYRLWTRTCENDINVNVVAYPDVQWTVQFTVGIGERKSTHNYYNAGEQADWNDGKGEKYQAYTASKREVKGRFHFEGKVGCRWDGTPHDLTHTFKSYIDGGMRAVNVCKEIADTVGPRLRQLGGSKLTVNWPMFTVGGKWGWEEVPKSPSCGYAYDVFFKADPFIGLQAKIDILLWLCNAVPGVGPFLARLKYKYGEEDDNNNYNLKIDLTVSGALFAEFHYKKPADRDKVTPQGKAGGKIGFQVEANIKVERKLAFKFVMMRFGSVTAGVAVKGGAKAEISPYLKADVDKQGPYYQGVVEFNGLSFYGSFAVSWNRKVKPVEPVVMSNAKVVKGPLDPPDPKPGDPKEKWDKYFKEEDEKKARKAEEQKQRDEAVAKGERNPDPADKVDLLGVHKAWETIKGYEWKGEKVVIPPAKWWQGEKGRFLNR
jgi:hypothetical protein